MEFLVWICHVHLFINRLGFSYDAANDEENEDDRNRERRKRGKKNNRIALRN
jgi:hypothetical protein